MKFTTPPGALEENIDAGPPRTTSMRSMVSSRRNDWSAFSQPRPGSCWIGNPSSSMPTAVKPSSRNAARANVRARLATGGFDPEARHGTECIGDTERRIHAQRFAADGRDGVAHFHFAYFFDTCAAGDHDGLDVSGDCCWACSEDAAAIASTAATVRATRERREFVSMVFIPNGTGMIPI